jgi:Protein of unknown function (DUF3108)
MRFGRLGLALVLAASLFAGAAEAEPLRLRYELWAGGIGVLGFDFALEETQDAYRVDGDFRTRGFSDFLFRFAMHASAEGGIAEKGVLPRRYASRSQSRRGRFTSDLDFLTDGEITATVTPLEEEPRTPIPARSLPGSLDPLSAILSIARGLSAGRPCAGRLPIYDGKRRYDVILEDKGPEELAPSAWSAFAGTARTCRVKQIRLGGFLERPRDDITPEATIWIASLIPGTLAVPVRIELDSGWGSLMVHVVEATFGEARRGLPEQ